MKVTNLGICCEVCGSLNVFDDEYAKNLRYTAWIKCDKCKQHMWLTDEVKRAGWGE